MTEVAVGQRVRLHAPSPLLTLRSDLGIVARPDERYRDMGYWIVRLDEPATYRKHDGTETVLPEVVEHEGNLTVIEDQP